MAAARVGDDSAGWLVWDRQHHGQIRTGFQLIGQSACGVFRTDGFKALRALNDNRDGELTRSELDGLSLWRDANVDGASQAGEVHKLAVHGIVALSTRGAAKSATSSSPRSPPAQRKNAPPTTGRGRPRKVLADAER